MPTQTQHTNDEVQEGARLALSAYNYFNVTDGEQNPLAGLAALRALFVARITSTPDEEEEKRKYIEDWDYAIVVIALLDADVTGANTKLAMQTVFVNLNPGMSPNYLSQIHYQR